MFSEEEKKILSRYVTNLDSNIFALKNLPEVVKGALFSRYSRSSRGLREVLLREFVQNPESGFFDDSHKEDSLVSIRKAEEFYERVLVGYGDDSVAELAGAHIAVESVSILASKEIEDSRIGISPLEKSTRYVFFDKKVDGEYLYYRGPGVSELGLYERYVEHMDFLFDSYSELIPPVREMVEEKFPKPDDASERAYKSSVKAKVCDILRGILPVGTLTNLGLYGNGRAFEYLLIKLYASDLRECRDVASSMHKELRKVIPSFVKRANNNHGIAWQEFIISKRNSVRKIAPRFCENSIEDNIPIVKLVDFLDNNSAESIICAHILFPHCNETLNTLFKKCSSMSREERNEIISAYCSGRKNRRHKPMRAFENIRYTFEITGNYGMFRDLHRHRMLTQERQLFSADLGYDVPKEILEFGLEDRFKRIMEKSKSFFNEFRKQNAFAAQYSLPMAYRIRWYFNISLRELYHLCELRSSPQGHPDYRKVAQQMYLKVKEVHPELVRWMVFVDLGEKDSLERLSSEKKIDEKLDIIKKKYGISLGRDL